MFIARKRKWKQNPEARRRKARRLASQCLLLAFLKFTTFWLQGCFIGAILGALMSILSAVAPLIGPGLQLATSIVGVVGQASAAGNQQAAAGPAQQPGPGFVGQTPNVQNAANPLGVPAATPGANPPVQGAPAADAQNAATAAANAGAAGAVDNGKPDDGKTDDGKTDDGKTDDGKTDDGKTDDGKTDDGKTDDGKTDDGKTDDGKTDDGKTDDGKTKKKFGYQAD